DAGAGFEGRSTKTVLCEQRRHTLCQGKEAEAVPAESIHLERSRTVRRNARTYARQLVRSLYQLRRIKSNRAYEKSSKKRSGLRNPDLFVSYLEALIKVSNPLRSFSIKDVFGALAM